MTNHVLWLALAMKKKGIICVLAKGSVFCVGWWCGEKRG